MTGGGPATPDKTDWGKLVRETAPKKVVEFGIAAILIAPLIWLKDRITADPWGGLLIAVPLALAAAVLGVRIFRLKELSLKGPLRWFSLSFAILFAILAGSDLLVWKRTPMQGLEDQAPKYLLGLARLGDWRYLLAARAPASPEILIVTRATPPNRETARADLAGLIAMAQSAGARAVALDLRLEGSTPLDGRLCRFVIAAREAVPSMPVLFGHGFLRSGGDLLRMPLGAAIETCAPHRRFQGHLVVYRDGDTRIRHLPLGLRGSEDLPALSVRLARVLDSTIRPGRLQTKLLQPIPPSTGFSTVRMEDLNAANVERMRDRLVLVGEDSPEETFLTPTGAVLGVELHARAVNALLAGSHFRRLAWWPGLVALILGTYGLALAAQQGRRKGQLVRLAVAMVVGWAVAVADAAWRSVWVDLGHVTLGLALFAAILLLPPASAALEGSCFIRCSRSSVANQVHAPYRRIQIDRLSNPSSALPEYQRIATVAPMTRFRLCSFSK